MRKTLLLVAAAFSAGMVVLVAPRSRGASTRTRSSASSRRSCRTSRPTTSRTWQEQEAMYGAARGLTDVLDSALALHGPQGVRQAQAGRPRATKEIEGIGIDVERRKTRLRDRVAHRGLSCLQGPASSRATSSSASTAWTSRRARVRRRRLAHAGPGAAARSRWSSIAAAASCRSASSARSYEVKAVEGKLLEDGVGYIKIRIFASNTDSALGEQLDQLNAKATGACSAAASLDLRPQPGRPARPGRSSVSRSLHRRAA